MWRLKEEIRYAYFTISMKYGIAVCLDSLNQMSSPTKLYKAFAEKAIKYPPRLLLSGAIPNLAVPRRRNYSIQQTLCSALHSPRNNLFLGTLLDYKLTDDLFTRELTLRHSFISWWTLQFINGSSFTPTEGQLCTMMHLASIVSDKRVLMLALINCGHCVDEVTSKSRTLFQSISA